MSFREFQSVIAKTRSVSPARKLRSTPGFPHIFPRKMSHARPALHTVFSTTQLELPKTHHGSHHHGFGDASDNSSAMTEIFWILFTIDGMNKAVFSCKLNDFKTILFYPMRLLEISIDYAFHPLRFSEVPHLPFYPDLCKASYGGMESLCLLHRISF
jgi:hypothetical protein